VLAKCIIIAETPEQATANGEVMGLTPRECMNW